jgi:hypothetical protein
MIAGIELNRAYLIYGKGYWSYLEVDKLWIRWDWIAAELRI